MKYFKDNLKGSKPVTLSNEEIAKLFCKSEYASADYLKAWPLHRCINAFLYRDLKAFFNLSECKKDLNEIHQLAMDILWPQQESEAAHA